MLCLLILSFCEIIAKGCVVVCCFVILPGCSWFRVRLLIQSLFPHKTFVSPAPDRCLLYVLPEVSPCLLSFRCYLYQILGIYMWCSGWHTPRLASKSQVMCQCCKVQKERPYGHPRSSCAGCGEGGSWQLVADRVDKDESSVADFVIQYLWCGARSAFGGLCSTYGHFFSLPLYLRAGKDRWNTCLSRGGGNLGSPVCKCPWKTRQCPSPWAPQRETHLLVFPRAEAAQSTGKTARVSSSASSSHTAEKQNSVATPSCATGWLPQMWG